MKPQDTNLQRGRRKASLLAVAMFVGTIAAMTLGQTTSAGAVESRFGCYQVTTSALNVRERAWSRSDVVTTVSRGAIVAKRRRFCALRGFWCPVRTADGVSGWAAKRHLKRVACS